ncbi:MAG TPA: 50S ribosomal protein L9 [Candidatus Merdiplasma excrementigallinarum]|uniref:Large ribosomal subunit protein bL9 n=1 Tax=Candidatus Merdiplasma excrementigallinarum TaxID=2840864 RepID=A0A9D1NYL4_9FIRM|nr:50S ribosomal protein L9 [Candidatus Merdiplasma excrementigallinarum]
MKVILLTDVKNVGKKGQVVEVSDSYARNVLIKKKQGLEATGKNMNDLKLQKANDEKVAAQNLADARVLAEQIEKSSIVLKVKVGEGGKLFGSISTKEIAEAVKEQLDLEVDKKKIQITNPIKSTGEMDVPIKLHTKVTARLKVHVESL